jgi:hypothetical protein
MLTKRVRAQTGYIKIKFVDEKVQIKGRNLSHVKFVFEAVTQVFGGNRVGKGEFHP